MRCGDLLRLDGARAPAPTRASPSASLHSIFAVQQECSDGASKGGENQKSYESQDEAEDHDEGKAIAGVDEINDLLHARIRGVGGVLSNVIQKGIVDFFSGA